MLLILQKTFSTTKRGRNVFLPLRPHTLISLWDMTHFFISSFAESYMFFCDQIDQIEKRIEKEGEFYELKKDELQKISESLENLLDSLDVLNAKRAIESLELIYYKHDDIKYLRDLKKALISANLAILTDLDNVKMAYIPANRVEFFEQKKLFGNTVFRAFPEAREEIKDAGNCLAADLNTAAVFHLMRVVELGLRELAARLKAKALIKKLKQTKIPIDLGTWEEIITTLEKKLDDLRLLTRSHKREQKIEICLELLKEFRSIKDLWRNKVMHTRAIYDAKQAESAFEHVRNFMQKLESVKKF
jgi:hypothetical protein